MIEQQLHMTVGVHNLASKFCEFSRNGTRQRHKTGSQDNRSMHSRNRVAMIYESQTTILQVVLCCLHLYASHLRHCLAPSCAVWLDYYRGSCVSNRSLKTVVVIICRLAPCGSVTT